MKKKIQVILLILFIAIGVLVCFKGLKIGIAMTRLDHMPHIDASALAGDYYSGDDLLSIERENGELLYSMGYFMLAAGNLGFDGKIIDITDHTITIYLDDYDFMEQDVDEYDCATYEYTLEDGVLTLEPEGTFYLNGVGEPEE